MSVDPHPWGRVLLVGEDNPYTPGESGRALAFYHLPRSASGNRLRRVLGLRDSQYDQLAKTNLCAGSWDRAAARRYVRSTIWSNLDQWDVVVACGAKVRDALGIRPEGVPAVVRHDVSDPIERTATIVVLPHPSGRSMAWNERSAVARCRACLRTAAPDLPWGNAPDALPGIRS